MNTRRPARVLPALAATLLAASSLAHAGAVRTGMFDANVFAGNDDGSVSVALPFTVNFFGITRSSAFLNNNGNITFDSALSTFTPFPLTGTNRQIIAPFFADVDTRPPASLDVTYGNGTVDGRAAFGINWIDVGYFSNRVDKLNSFQLVLIDRSDTGVGNFDFEFNYDKVLWETGDVSGGSGGLGGNSARAGYSNGLPGADERSFEIIGSAGNGAFLDSNLTTGLIHNSIGSTVDGRYLFSARAGVVTPAAVPLPSAASAGLALASSLTLARRRRQTP